MRVAPAYGSGSGAPATRWPTCTKLHTVVFVMGASIVFVGRTPQVSADTTEKLRNRVYYAPIIRKMDT